MRPIIAKRKVEKAAKEIIHICGKAWDKNFMPGLSGNASIRLSGDTILITRAGAPKGFLKSSDCIMMNLNGNKDGYFKNVSSEWRMHTASYENKKECQAILHTHPQSMQIIDLLISDIATERKFNIKSFLHYAELYEAKIWLPHLVVADKSEPGSEKVGENCVKALANIKAQLPYAIWLPGHGLTVLATDLTRALSLSEELNHLANVCLGIRHQILEKQLN